MPVDLEVVYQDLQQLKIQGATAVAQTIATALASYIHQTKKRENYREIKKVADYLLSARPTEAMIHNGIYFMLASLKGLLPISLFTGTADVLNPDASLLKNKLNQEGVQIDFMSIPTCCTNGCFSLSLKQKLVKKV